ncbi:Kif12 type kinesin-like protein [Scenedesmus sp. NREL 46B-D3]|nr:Kif12 type kinesin-like protein [Scenedesmus sp. NREL 46B-D3]
MQKEFSFHACLGPETSQADVMALCGIQQLLDAALAGYHVTIFAYGQTGSGKTHTMSGKEDIISDDAYNGHDHDGIISRAVHYLFQQMHTRKDAKYSLKASYLEIYNEGVYDLVHFSPKAKSLPVKWDARYGFYVQGLKVVPCSQQRTMMEVIRTGMKHRKVGSHRLNMESSRSHAIMSVYCDATPTDPNSYDFGTIRYGKLSFVDLAGSERVKDSMSEGTMLKETININKSLSVLGKVISTLAERDAAGTTAHVPYRDSKLTKLLMDSLGGSALTLMIACCSPSSLQVGEDVSTLSYATRAKNIHNRPTVQYDPREAQISLLRREIELLRQENGLLREQLKAGGAAAGVRACSWCSWDLAQLGMRGFHTAYMLPETSHSRSCQSSCFKTM